MFLSWRNMILKIIMQRDLNVIMIIRMVSVECMLNIFCYARLLFYCFMIFTNNIPLVLSTLVFIVLELTPLFFYYLGFDWKHAHCCLFSNADLFCSIFCDINSVFLFSFVSFSVAEQGGSLNVRVDEANKRATRILRNQWLIFWTTMKKCISIVYWKVRKWERLHA